MINRISQDINHTLRLGMLRLKNLSKQTFGSLPMPEGAQHELQVIT